MRQVMSRRFTQTPRAWVLALTLAVVAVSAALSPVLAQDPRGAAAQKAARDWLAITDSLDALVSWNAAGPRFKEAMTVKQWDASIKEARAPYGTLGQRAILTTTFGTRVEGGPEGDYALVQFRTTFATKADARETVTLERGAEGEWHVIGYFIH
jgi:hypothetical protein